MASPARLETSRSSDVKRTEASDYKLGEWVLLTRTISRPLNLPVTGRSHERVTIFEPVQQQLVGQLVMTPEHARHLDALRQADPERADDTTPPHATVYHLAHVTLRNETVWNPEHEADTARTNLLQQPYANVIVSETTMPDLTSAERPSELFDAPESSPLHLVR